MASVVSYEEGGKINVKAAADHFFQLPFNTNFALEALSGICKITRVNTF
jgi:hypothetical protein